MPSAVVIANFRRGSCVEAIERHGLSPRLAGVVGQSLIKVQVVVVSNDIDREGKLAQQAPLGGPPTVALFTPADFYCIEPFCRLSRADTLRPMELKNVRATRVRESP